MTLTSVNPAFHVRAVQLPSKLVSLLGQTDEEVRFAWMKVAQTVEVDAWEHELLAQLQKSHQRESLCTKSMSWCSWPQLWALLFYQRTAKRKMPSGASSGRVHFSNRPVPWCTARRCIFLLMISTFKLLLGSIIPVFLSLIWNLWLQMCLYSTQNYNIQNFSHQY